MELAFANIKYGEMFADVKLVSIKIPDILDHGVCHRCGHGYNAVVVAYKDGGLLTDMKKQVKLPHIVHYCPNETVTPYSQSTWQELHRRQYRVTKKALKPAAAAR